jgi:Uma2 family endonuclease
VVQPDLCVICDPAKIDERGCIGAPDWIIEITSQSTFNHDRFTKKELYEAAGVGEYWIVYPNEKIVEVYRAETDGSYSTPLIFGKDEDAVVTPSLFPALQIDLAEVFA